MSGNDGSLLEGKRVLIIAGDYFGQEGVCLGRAADSGKWAISPNGTTEIVELEFETAFGLLTDPSSNSESPS